MSKDTTQYQLRQISSGLYCTGISGPGWGNQTQGMFFKGLGSVGRAVSAFAENRQWHLDFLERAKRDKYDTLTPEYEAHVLKLSAENVPENMEIVPYELVAGQSWPVGQKPPKKRV